jgi:hypothetical protein
MPKMIIINGCTECKKCEWIYGKPRCTDETMVIEQTSENDFCPYPRVFNDGTRPFLEGCPLKDI